MFNILTGPWMTTFYTSSSELFSHIEGTAIVRSVIYTISMTSSRPSNVLHITSNFFKNTLRSSNETLQKLQEKPVHESLFITMMKEYLTTTVTILQRCFNMDITEQLRQKTESARTHNIDAEVIMNMFIAAKDHAPNSTLCCLSPRMRVQKNHTCSTSTSTALIRRDETRSSQSLSPWLASNERGRERSKLKRNFRRDLP